MKQWDRHWEVGEIYYFVLSILNSPIVSLGQCWWTVKEVVGVSLEIISFFFFFFIIINLSPLPYSVFFSGCQFLISGDLRSQDSHF